MPTQEGIGSPPKRSQSYRKTSALIRATNFKGFPKQSTGWHKTSSSRLPVPMCGLEAFAVTMSLFPHRQSSLSLSGSVTPWLPEDSAELGTANFQEWRARPWREMGYETSAPLCLDFSARSRTWVPPGSFPKLGEGPPHSPHGKHQISTL